MAHNAVVVETPLHMAQRHVRRLAALDGASSSAIVDAISLWPLGMRLSLSAHDIIDYSAGADAAATTSGSLTAQDVEAAANRGEPLDFGITQTGLRVIAECARWVATHGQTAAEDGNGSPEVAATAEELEEVRPGDNPEDGKPL